MKQQRVNRLLKLCRRYLHWIRNQVFEGGVSEVTLTGLLAKARAIMTGYETSIVLFKRRTQQWMMKQVVGRKRSTLGTTL